MHPITVKAIMEAAKMAKFLTESDQLSETSQKIFLRFLERYNVRHEKALNDEKTKSDKANLMKIGMAIGRLALAAGAAFLRSRSKSPTEIFHHFDSAIDSKITGSMQENININWPLTWY